MLLAEEQKCQS